MRTSQLNRPDAKISFSPINNPIRYLKGVGPKKAEILKKIGIETVDELLTYYPRSYEDRTRLRLIAQIADGETTSIQATVISHAVIATKRGKRILKITLSDGTGKAVLVCFNQMYLKDYLKKGTTIIVNGKFEKTFRSVSITNFSYEILSQDSEDLIHTGRIVPIYPLAEGVNARFLRALIKKVVDEYAPSREDMLGTDVKNKYGLCPTPEAIKNIHFPEDFEAKDRAYERLAFDEFFLMELGLAMRKRKNKSLTKGITYKIKKTLLSEFRKGLPFDFTGDQKKVIREIFTDMQSSNPMNRLLQGDVGSGKTVVALSALLLAVENGYQGVLMAPTEVLAQQHYITITRMLEGLIKDKKLRVLLLVGGSSKTKKNAIKGSVTRAKADIIIGTHAIIQEGVSFESLGLAVIDEQHKFGVMQRAKLRRKGFSPDVLVMTATPIPRTLSLTVYGDLDVSVINELPPGRGKIRTLKMEEDAAYELVREEVAKGRQAYIVYPLIDESEKLSLKAANMMSKKFKEKIFPDMQVGLLHGRLGTAQKESVMDAFRQRQIDVLVTTSVIEVGMDIHNASLMLIEESNRFGLASLHQLRGRVGRGNYDSYCILMGNASTGEAKRRISSMLSTGDGFKIAEEDLALRGPGEFFGTRQHGLPELKIGNIIQDFSLLVRARDEAFSIIEKDPSLSLGEHQKIKQLLLEKFAGRLELISVG
ncbi:MAG: ATP-dependent DNA helicase RecG [bacterium]